MGEQGNRKMKRLTFAVILTLMMGILFPAVKGYAAEGQIYTCTINRGYRHPVTGVVEDSGGEGSFATGQGMVEGCIGITGLFETTDSGEHYLTIRMGLADFTSNRSFKVQVKDDTEWTDVEAVQTASGSDDNGETVDMCIPVPSEKCIVRGSMFVDPMGRDVIFFLYPSDFEVGNNTDMNATIVTEITEGGEAPDIEGAEIEEPLPDVESSTLGSAEGLSLSTEKEEAAEETAGSTEKSNMPVVIGIGVAAVVVIAGIAIAFSKKNKNKGDTRDDDE